MEEGAKKLQEQMERAGWQKVRTFPPGTGLADDAVEGMGQDAGGDLSIHVEADRAGAGRSYQITRRLDAAGEEFDASGRIRHAGVPTPEEAMGRWEELRADVARGLT